MSAPEPARSNSSNASFTSASLCGRHKKMGDGVRRASHVAGRVGRSEPGGLARPGGCDDGPRARGSIASTHSGGRADARTRGARTVMAAGAVSLEEFARSAGKERWSCRPRLIERSRDRQRQELSTHGGGTSAHERDRKGQSDHQHL